jgi:hypothetical protein
MKRFDNKYAVIRVDAEGNETFELFHLLRQAKQWFNMTASSMLYKEIYLTTYTKTRGFGQIIRRY